MEGREGCGDLRCRCLMIRKVADRGLLPLPGGALLEGFEGSFRGDENSSDSWVKGLRSKSVMIKTFV